MLNLYDQPPDWTTGKSVSIPHKGRHSAVLRIFQTGCGDSPSFVGKKFGSYFLGGLKRLKNETDDLPCSKGFRTHGLAYYLHVIVLVTKHKGKLNFENNRTISVLKELIFLLEEWEVAGWRILSIEGLHCYTS